MERISQIDICVKGRICKSHLLKRLAKQQNKFLNGQNDTSLTQSDIIQFISAEMPTKGSIKHPSHPCNLNRHPGPRPSPLNPPTKRNTPEAHTADSCTPKSSTKEIPQKITASRLNHSPINGAQLVRRLDLSLVNFQVESGRKESDPGTSRPPLQLIFPKLFFGFQCHSPLI